MGTITETYIKRQGFRAVGTLVSVYTDECFTTLEETSLQTDDNELHSRSLSVTLVLTPRGI